MSEQQFNLVTDPWIKVIDEKNQEQTVSLNQVFEKATQYQRLAGEMRSQDLAILRFLLAILTTVYSRYDAYDQPYHWLQIDDKTMCPVSFDDDSFSEDEQQIKDELLSTWKILYQSKQFSQAVIMYLNNHQDKFDLLNKDNPFYQVTKEQYDDLVPTNKSVEKGKGTVAVKQINRTISESNNKPDIFSPNSPAHKNDISLDSLARWLITYQNFTAVTDKTKVKSEDKFSVSRGWLYGLNPVFAVGKNLFDTLMLNMILVPQKELFDDDLINQEPVWEVSVNEYVHFRKNNQFPTNLAQLYTVWSRIIHIEWDGERPIIFSAGLPKLDNQDAFLEPMTTWKPGKKGEGAKPNLRWLNSLGKAMWRNFGQYVAISNNDDLEPGIVTWLKLLKHNKFIRLNDKIHLMTVGLINDGNATSQSPAAEFYDDMQINADVLFDDNSLQRNYWPRRIEDTIELTEKVGAYVWHFANNAGKLRGVADAGSFANRISAEFYNQLNRPFNEWLSQLTNHDDRDQQVNEWKRILKQISLGVSDDLMRKATPQEIRGKQNEDGTENNIFVQYRIFKSSLVKALK
ncbi:type I-E CRISPR-associated protein Cse1/CasA [Limosilactobacillus fastidiosus]|nr:type I-E CRISPR-associated protein Cse1/CasA [Limosilactobacillus fastidiosus]MCD7084084.1 type I-E CRISPR-associated protein Cse1/CasA [Limosilactobacillus fastidiosus]